MGRVCPAQLIRERLPQPEVADLPLGHEFRELADAVLHRNLRVDTGQVEEVDVIRPQPSQRCVAVSYQLGGIAVDARGFPAIRRPDAAIRCDQGIAAPVDEQLPKQRFRLVMRGTVGGVEHRDAHVERQPDDSVAVTSAGLAVDAGKRRCAESDRGRDQARRAETSRFHLIRSPGRSAERADNAGKFSRFLSCCANSCHSSWMLSATRLMSLSQCGGIASMNSRHSPSWIAYLAIQRKNALPHSEYRRLGSLASLGDIAAQVACGEPPPSAPRAVNEYLASSESREALSVGGLGTSFRCGLRLPTAMGSAPLRIRARTSCTVPSDTLVSLATSRSGASGRAAM